LKLDVPLDSFTTLEWDITDETLELTAIITVDFYNSLHSFKAIQKIF